MLTPFQFAQVAAAAWSGPAAARFATVEHYTSAEGSYTATSYRVSYHPHGSSGPCYSVSAPCPFEAVAQAVAAAAAAGVPVCRRHALTVLGRTAAALCGVQFVAPGFACRARRHRSARVVYA